MGGISNAGQARSAGTTLQMKAAERWLSLRPCRLMVNPQCSAPEAENDGAVGVQCVAPQGAVVSIEETGKSQEDEWQKAAVA